MNVAGASEDPLVLHFHVDLQKSLFTKCWPNFEMEITTKLAVALLQTSGELHKSMINANSLTKGETNKWSLESLP